MTITRNGKTFNLTPEETRQAAREVWEACIAEDIEDCVEQYRNFHRLAYADMVVPTAEYVDRLLMKNDLYMEAYWDTIEYAIKEMNRGR